MVEYAKKICKRLHAYLRGGHHTGMIRLITPGSMRLETDIGVVSILSNTSCLQPFSMIVNETKPFTESDLVEGQRVELDEERILFVDSEAILDVSQATDMDLSIDVLRSLFLPLDINNRVRLLIRSVEDNAGTSALAGLATGAEIDASCEPVKRELAFLHQTVYEQSLAECHEAGSRLAGFGNGATPDSDDMLEGYFAGYAALSAALGRSMERVRSMTREIAAGAAERTTDLSAALLLQAGEGLISEDMLHLLQSLFSDVPYRTVVMYANRVAKSEAPSGTNLLVGVAAAIQYHYVPARIL